MDLESLVANESGVRKASHVDSNEILDFFDSQDMNTPGLNIQYDRSPDFFSFLKMQSSQFHVLLAENKMKKCQGVASFTLRDGYINGELCKVGYLGDLRIGFDRRILRTWRQLYGKLVDQQNAWHSGCRYFLTAILEDNISASRALISPKNADYIYEPLTRYVIVQAFAQNPIRSHASKCIVRRATEGDGEKIANFLNKNQKTRMFGFSAGEWKRRRESWGVCWSDFYLIEEAGGLRACVAPWSPDRAKRIRVDKIPKAIDLSIGLGNRLGLTRLPRNGRELKVLYMTHLCFEKGDDKSELFNALLLEMLKIKRQRNYHSVSFPQFPGDGFDLKPFFTHKLPARLYSVRHRRTPPLLTSTRLGEEKEYGFEMALV